MVPGLCSPGLEGWDTWGRGLRKGRKQRLQTGEPRGSSALGPAIALGVSGAAPPPRTRRGLCRQPAPCPARGAPRGAAPGWVSLPRPAGIEPQLGAGGTRRPEPTWGGGVTGGGGRGRKGSEGAGGGHSPALKVPAGTGSFPRHPGVPMAPTVPLAVLALLALVAPGLGAAPGCDYPAHRWCSSRDTAVACQVRAAAAAAGAGDKGRVTGTRGHLPPAQGRGDRIGAAPGASASCERR